MILLIDNYDSFTWNLVHYIGGLGAEVEVRRNDTLTVDEAMALKPEAIVISPGPATPNEAGISCALIARAAAEGVPVFGVCLGHQAIGQVFGGDVVRAPQPIHGKLSNISHSNEGVFHGINGTLRATRYHSLVVKRDTLPDALAVTAQTDDGLIMGLSHKTLPVHGVQFHPESIASEHGRTILKNFLDLARAWNAGPGRKRAA
ncbi:anthranilate synthase component II [Ancylobacter rudongensis]|jgi:anthranilate synthase component 2|uniref:Anthranilate synthase component 2 n=1 Tax=Ancylobacter rudongensis TaxID=177413 RepID=A0A1G4QCC9_9HYPH|nr:aminodeoxychorismate/anthranilate synthase component II [Ancylobacter rudongensis]RTL88438.1 aminodeoxychorismate/anthranilate synthase component II [Ancylobacter aquaticus]SCW41779.1 anthranilate synthase component 2 [Ancylobacter rudongensis]